MFTPTRRTVHPLALCSPMACTYADTGCTAGEPLGHLGEPVREFTIDPKHTSKISLKILHFPLPAG